MKIEKLYLRTFRSYANLEISFHPHLNFIYGPNASGKTNILEALSILSLGKSFREAHNKDVIQEKKEGYYSACKYTKQSTEHKLSYAIEIKNGKMQRKIKLNQEVLPGRKHLIGHIFTTIFSPSDISIVNDGPAYQRKFLDTVLSHQSKNYFQNLIFFNQSLRHRNAVLKNIRIGSTKHQDLEAWDVRLSKYALIVTKNRFQFIHDFCKIFENSLRQISQNKDIIKIDLSLSHPNELENYLQILRENYKRDISLGYTSIGPHRQGLAFKENGQDVLHRLSQGQKRSLALALRIAQFYFLKSSLGFSPVLLIDDVIGELDKNRKSAFIKLLKDCGQAIITTPNLDEIDQEFLSATEQMYIYKTPLKNGEFKFLRVSRNKKE